MISCHSYEGCTVIGGDGISGHVVISHTDQELKGEFYAEFAASNCSFTREIRAAEDKRELGEQLPSRETRARRVGPVALRLEGRRD